MTRHALVTGAAGFVGRRLVARLVDEGWTVTALVRRAAGAPAGARVVEADLTDGGGLEAVAAGADVVFHLAGKVHDLEERGDTGSHRAVTVEGTRRLLDACAERRPALVFASSLAVYGPTGQACVDETAAPRPDTPYGRAKLDAEALVHEWGRRTGAHVCSLRPAMVYGPGCKGNLVRMVRAIDRGLFPPLPETGNRRSLVGVDDVVTALVLAATLPAARDRRFNLTDARPCSTREMYEAVCRALGRTPPAWRLPVWALRAGARAGDLAGRVRGKRLPLDSLALDRLLGSAWFSSAAIERDLGFRPSADFPSAGASDVVASYARLRA